MPRGCYSDHEANCPKSAHATNKKPQNRSSKSPRHSTSEGEPRRRAPRNRVFKNLPPILNPNVLKRQYSLPAMHQKCAENHRAIGWHCCEWKGRGDDTAPAEPPAALHEVPRPAAAAAVAPPWLTAPQH